MGERRLIEITSTISNMDGPLNTMVYVTSLNSSDVYLLLKYVGTSKYRNLSFIDALICFSNDYLKSKNVMSDETDIELEKKR